jgi:type 2 lantibiotic biosynthesis protein LanM
MTNTPHDATPFLDAAWDIGAQLCRDAIWDGDRCNWLGDSMEVAFNSWHTVHRSFGPDLYSGTSGIALFLARLNGLRPDPLLETTARGAVRQALSRIDDIASAQHTSFYSGRLGVAWALLQLAELLREPAWTKEANRLLDSILGLDVERYNTDVLGGIAGTAMVLLTIWRRTKREALLTEAVRLGDELLKTANRDGDAMSWTTMHPETGFLTRDLTGYSHGAAGIALALLELATATGRRDFREAAYAGFRYERRWYSPQQQNWPDFRNDPRAAQPQPAQPAYAVAWCHGAPGIGLSRLRAYELTGDQEILLEADAAIQGTYKPMTGPVTDNYSLCHGLGGNAELFIIAARIVGNPQYKAVADYIGQRAIQTVAQAREPWPCGVNGGGETPNLMLGLAGIGYFFLRLHDPANVPSVLMVN